MSIDWEVISSLAIIAVMLLVAFKGGRSNPMSTGALDQRISKIEKKTKDELHKIGNEMQALEGRFAASATKADIAALRVEIAEAATARSELAAQELGKIKDRVTTVCTKVEGLEGTVDTVAEGVKRIEGFFLKKGIEGK